YDFMEGAKLTVLGGKQRIGMGFDLSDSFISGANLDFSVSQLANMETTDVNVGLSYVGRYENLQDEYPEIDKMTNMYALRADMTKGGFYLGAEYVYKSDDALVEDRGKTILETQKYDGN